MSDDASSQEGDGGLPHGMPADEDLPESVKVAAGDLSRALAARKRAKILKSGRPSSSSSASRTRPVVKLLVTSVSRSYSEPWRRRQQRESSGTGFLIRWRESHGAAGEAIRIVTNAHVVRNASTVRARASFGPHVVSCDVEWLSLPLDLALLRIAEGDWGDFCKGWGLREERGSPAAAAGRAADDAAEDGEEASAVATEGTAAGLARGRDGTGGRRKTADAICLTLSPTLPKLDENVTCVGFPQGGTQISVTRGVVSRIDVDAHYVLRIQIDAAINPGNSGGPVFDERGQVVGIASSHLRGAGNIGYIIPSKIVAMFLQMSMDGMAVGVEDRFSGLGALVVQADGDENEPRHVPGICNVSIHGSQGLESKALRRHLGLEDMDLSGGVRIVGAIGTAIGVTDSIGPPDGTEEGAGDQDGGKLQANDVLLAINNIPIGMDGTIQLSPTRPDERINFRSLVTCQRVGSKVSLDVLRCKQRMELEVVLDVSKFLVSQYDGFDAVPLYVVVGGCVFSPLSLPLVDEKKSKNPSAFSRYYRSQRIGHEQILVLSKVLNDDVNVGYHGWKNLVLKSVNGYEPSNIQELVNVLARKIRSEMIEFRCHLVGQEDDADYVICMALKEVLSSEHRVLKQHMIASWCSTDALSRGLLEEVAKREPSEAKRTVCFNKMKDTRAVLEKKEEK